MLPRSIQAALERWWASLFERDGPYFPGNVPTLETTNDALAATYYGALLSLAAVGKLAPSPDGEYAAFRSVGATAGATALYMWDTGYASDVWALLDAESVKRVGALFVAKADLSHNNVLDLLTTRGAGKYYAFSRFATFLTLHAGQALDDDGRFYDDRVAGRRVLEWMDDLATFWLGLDALGPGVADYGGDPDGFLECVPSYVHGIAALAAANTWMLRATAALHRKDGNASRAETLSALANRTSDGARSLFVEDGGYFAALYPNGTKVPVRTCVDFISVANAMGDDLDAAVKTKMADFTRTELLTPGWMRALSQLDAAAPDSDRADHGPRGAWDGWVGLTAQAFGNIGDYLSALHIVESAAGVLTEGPYGQAHRVYGPNNTVMLRPPRKGGDQAYLSGVFGS